jgi:hypothetical protein
MKTAFSPTVLASLIGFAVLVLMPTFIAGSLVAGGTL